VFTLDLGAPALRAGQAPKRLRPALTSRWPRQGSTQARWQARGRSMRRSARPCAPARGRTLFLLRRAAVRAVGSDDDRGVAILAVRGALVHAHRAAAGARLRAPAHPGARQRCLSSRRAGRPTYQDGLRPAGPGRAAGPRGGISATLVLTAIWEVRVLRHRRSAALESVQKQCRGAGGGACVGLPRYSFSCRRSQAP